VIDGFGALGEISPDGNASGETDDFGALGEGKCSAGGKLYYF